MRMIAIHAQTERKRLDRSVRCAEKRRPWARKQRLRGLIRPDPAVCATAGAACGRKSLSSARIQAIFTSNATPLGECRFPCPRYPSLRKRREPDIRKWPGRVGNSSGNRGGGIEPPGWTERLGASATFPRRTAIFPMARGPLPLSTGKPPWKTLRPLSNGSNRGESPFSSKVRIVDRTGGTAIDGRPCRPTDARSFDPPRRPWRRDVALRPGNGRRSMKVSFA